MFSRRFPSTIPAVVAHWHRWAVALFLIPLLLVVGAVWAWGNMVTLPMAARADLLCAALGTEAPCATRAIGHVRGIVTFAAEDGAPLVALFTARGRTFAVSLGVADEMDVLARVADEQTQWVGLLPPAATWPALRALAHVTTGVPVLTEVRHRRGGTDGVESALGSTAIVKATVTLMEERP